MCNYKLSHFACSRPLSSCVSSDTPCLKRNVLLQQPLYSSNSISGFSLVCNRPPVNDGIDESTFKRVYEVGEEVTLTCERGYLPSTASPRRISCTAAGEWTRSDLVCSREYAGQLYFYTRELASLNSGDRNQHVGSKIAKTFAVGFILCSKPSKNKGWMKFHRL